MSSPGQGGVDVVLVCRVAPSVCCVGRARYLGDEDVVVFRCVSGVVVPVFCVEVRGERHAPFAAVVCREGCVGWDVQVGKVGIRRERFGRVPEERVFWVEVEELQQLRRRCGGRDVFEVFRRS